MHHSGHPPHDDHGHTGHPPGHHTHPATSARRLGLTLGLTGLFMLVEVAGGLWSGSLALLADAGHMLADTAALAIAFFATRAARRPPDALRSYGYHRTEVLAAFVNGMGLMIIVGAILWEAIGRLRAPAPVAGLPMLVIAGLGLLVNVAAVAILHGGDRHDLNLQGALLHVLGDLLGSLAAITAAGVILWTGWYPIDPLLSILVALLILRSTSQLLRRSTHILLEGTPDELDIRTLREELVATVPGVRDIHHVHVWSLKPGHTLLTMHVDVPREADDRTVLPAVKDFLRARYGIEHTTLQIESGPCPDRTPEQGGCTHEGS